MARSIVTNSLRSVLVVVVLSYYSQKYLGSSFFPYGTAVDVPMAERILGYAKVDPTNDLLQAKHGKLKKVIERVEKGQKPILKGPETVVVDKDGTIYAIGRGAKLIRLDDLQPSEKDPSILTARASIAKDLGGGSPLGGAFTPNYKTLYFADAVLGLTRIRDFHENKHAKVELVANKVTDDGVLTRILYADDVVVGPKTGKVYFSDATDIPPERENTSSDWDVMHASKLTYMRGSRKGRLLQYDPETEEIKVLAKGFLFANGVSVDKDETYVVISDTYSMQVSRYHLSGPKEGTLESVIESQLLTGFTDGADCSRESEGPSAGKCFVAVPTEIMTVAKIINKIPSPYDTILRSLLMMLPKWLSPEPTSYGCFVEVDVESGDVRTFQDPAARDMKLVTGVTFHDNKVYLGSLTQDTVGIYDLS